MVRCVSVMAVVCLATALLTTDVAANPVLLIPEDTGDTVGMYDPTDGHYLGDLITAFPPAATNQTPINSVLGPDGLIYTSDQVEDRVSRHSKAGAVVDVYTDNAASGIDNVRGIAFRDSDLFVVSANETVIARFNAAGVRQVDFVTGVDAFDILFLDDGRALVSDLGADEVVLYDAAGVFVSTLVSSVDGLDFPEQICEISTGQWAVTGFNSDEIYFFGLAGFGSKVPSPVENPRAAFALGNGNLLVTSMDGVHEVTMAGALVETERSGVSARYIERVDLDEESEPPVAEPAGLGVLGAVLGLALRRRR
jgi:MYXO-CTERM domain-containing protein